MKKRLLIAAALILAAALLIPITALADFGGFSGGSDYGGGGSSWGGSSWGDSGSSSGGVCMPVYYGDDYGSDGYSSGGSCTGNEMIMLIVIVLVIVTVLWFMSKRKSASAPVMTGVQRTDDSALLPIEQYIAELDEGFSVSDMQAKLSNLYVQLQDQWSAKDISPLRPYLTDELYTQSDRQLDEIRKSGMTPHIDNIAVLNANIRGWFRRDGMDHIIVEMYTRITTYSTSDKTGAIVKGDPNREKFMTYEWDLCRTSGLKTGDAAPMQTINCPNCGAPLSINKSAKCPYCESVITLDEHDWVLYSIKGLSQRTQ